MCEQLLCLVPRGLPAPLISLASAFLLSLSLPFPEFCSLAASEITRLIPVIQVGVSPVGGHLALLGLAVYFVHSTCWSVLGQGPSQVKPSRVALGT